MLRQDQTSFVQLHMYVFNLYAFCDSQKYSYNIGHGLFAQALTYTGGKM